VGGDDPRQELAWVVDPVVDDLLSLSDEELLAEVRADGHDPALLATEVQKELAAAVGVAGRLRLAEARAQLTSVRTLRRQPSITGLPLATKEQILRTFAANDGPLRERLTMAARNGDGLTEGEMDTVLLDLVELGAIDGEGKVR
jgi:hypothetical protein